MFMVLFSFVGPVIRTAEDHRAGRNKASCHRPTRGKGNGPHGSAANGAGSAVDMDAAHGQGRGKTVRRDRRANRTAPEQGGHGTALPATIAGQGLTWIGLAEKHAVSSGRGHPPESGLCFGD